MEVTLAGGSSIFHGVARVAPDGQGGACCSVLKSRYPVRLLAPHVPRSAAQWIYVCSYGGGIVSGDCISLIFRVESGALCVVTSQGYSLMLGGPKQSRVMMTYEVAAGAHLLVVPQPTAPLRDSRCVQMQKVQMHVSDAGELGQLFFLEWASAGRVATGERWAFATYASEVEIYVNESLVCRERLALGSPVARADISRCGVFGMCVVIGDTKGVAAKFATKEKYGSDTSGDNPQSDSAPKAVSGSTAAAHGPCASTPSTLPPLVVSGAPFEVYADDPRHGVLSVAGFCVKFAAASVGAVAGELRNLFPELWAKTGGFPLEKLAKPG